jgi:hypothetical protein
LRKLRTLDLSSTRVKGPLDPTKWESQCPQFVGIHAEPVPGHAIPPGRDPTNEQLRQAIEELRQADEAG